MANNFYGAVALIGGGVGAIDTIDGASLVDLDAVYAQTAGIFYPYTLDDDSGAAEDSPNVISPDFNAGTKRWVLQGLRVANIQADNISIAGNTMSSVNTNGDILLAPNGTGSVGIKTATPSDCSLEIYSNTAWSEFTRGNLKLSADANPSIRLFDIGANGTAVIECSSSNLRFRVGNTGDALDNNDTEFFMTNTSFGIGINALTPTLEKGLVIGNGTAATAILANSFSMWATDIDGAGTSGMVIMGEESITQLRFGGQKILSNSGIIEIGSVDNTNNERLTFDCESDANLVTVASPSGIAEFKFDIGTLSIASADATDKVSISHDNTNAYIQTDDGSIILKTDEGTNTHCLVEIHGKGTGNGQLRVFRNGDTLAWEINADSAYSYLTGYRPLYFQTISNNDMLFMPDGTGNMGIKTGSFDGTATGTLAIANGTAPGGGTANQSYIYARDVAASSEMHVMDEAGNETQISPHNPNVLENSDLSEQVPFSYSSKNIYLGKEIVLDMTAVIREVERLSGKTFITVTDIPIRDKQDWSENQETQRVARQKEIDRTELERDNLGLDISRERDERKIQELTEKRDRIIVPGTYIKKQPPQWLRDRGINLN